MLYRRIMNRLKFKYIQLTSKNNLTKIKSYPKNLLYNNNIYSAANIFDVLYKIIFVFVLIILGFSIYFRTTNMWALKNLGDSFIHKSIGRRPIVIGAFHRLPEEQNVKGAYAVCFNLFYKLIYNKIFISALVKKITKRQCKKSNNFILIINIIIKNF